MQSSNIKLAEHYLSLLLRYSDSKLLLVVIDDLALCLKLIILTPQPWTFLHRSIHTWTHFVFSVGLKVKKALFEWIIYSLLVWSFMVPLTYSFSHTKRWKVLQLFNFMICLICIFNSWLLKCLIWDWEISVRWGWHIQRSYIIWCLWHSFSSEIESIFILWEEFFVYFCLWYVRELLISQIIVFLKLFEILSLIKIMSYTGQISLLMWIFP